MSAVLPSRLAAAAELVRDGALLADVGTDHALLPIALLGAGRVRGAVVSDIAEGPLARARANLAAAGYGDRVPACLTDGLTGLDVYAPTDITLCGMGGETIRDILAAAPWVRDPAIRLICQPQSFVPLLRETLLREGFEISDERLCLDRGKYYVCFAATFSGCPQVWTPEELLLGRVNIARGGEVFRGYVRRQAQVLERQIAGRRLAGLASEQESLLLARLRAYSIY